MLADRGVRLDEAVGYIKKAVQMEPQNGAYLDSLGWAYYKLGNYPLAEENLVKAVERAKSAKAEPDQDEQTDHQPDRHGDHHLGSTP